MRLWANDVESAYGRATVFSNLSLSLEPGVVTGIIGPNGSGKSTLVRTLSRVLRPRMGAVLLDDMDIYTMPGNRVARSVAVVPQNGAPAFPYTVMEMVLMGRAPHLGLLEFEGPEDIEAARRAMGRTGILDLARRPLGTLSSGERQRVIIARALAQEPQVLLLDEPTSHLDIKYQVEIMELIVSLSHDDGLACGVVVHDINLAARYCDLVAMMKSGGIHCVGRPWDVLTPDNIREVYGVASIVMRHPVLGCPLVVTVQADARPRGGACNGIRNTASGRDFR